MTKLEIAAVVSGSKTRLRKMIPLVRDFLREQLGLELNMDKVAIYSAYRGVEFLGAYLRPFRIYVSKHCLARMNKRIVHLHRIHTWASPRILQPISSALAG